MKFTSLARLSAAATALVIWTLLFGEMFMRLLAPQAIMPRYITGTDYGIRGNIPGAIYAHSTPDVYVQYRINRQGMRDDRSFAEVKPAGTCRIAMLGDSYFVGYELDLKQTFQHQLEAQLRLRRHNVEVLNFAVSGFGTAENLRAYIAKARRFSPDLVLMEWQVTDYDDNLRSGLYKLKGGALVKGVDSFLPAVAAQDRLMRVALYRLLADHSHLFNFFREQVGWRIKQLMAFLAKRETGPSENEVEQNTYIVNQAQVDLAAALLRESHAEAARNGAVLMVVDIPNRTPKRVFSSSFDLMPADLKRQLPPISAILAFRQAMRNPRTSIFFDHGARHLTPVGARLLADEAVRRIEASGALGRCGGKERQPEKK
jgi:hypothetical protein